MNILGFLAAPSSQTDGNFLVGADLCVRPLWSHTRVRLDDSGFVGGEVV
jgi:hypothetical protein